jgi:hypothetical protein
MISPFLTTTAPTGTSRASRALRECERFAHEGFVVRINHRSKGRTATLQVALPPAWASRFAGDPHADRNPHSTSSIGAAFRAKMPETPRQY